MEFLDRERELGVLDRAWASRGAEMVLLYGRRRVGKSELIRHFLLDKPHILYVGARKSEREILAELTEQVHRLTGQALLLQQPFASWDAALAYLTDYARAGRRFVVALDELPYVCEATPSLPSVLQRWWDEVGQTLPIVLILSGSHVSFMERLAAESGELYGRRTRLIALPPFDYFDAGAFLPGYSAADRMRAYAVVGGMPAYLARFSDTASLAANIADQILQPGAFLRDEARLILIEELRAEATYHSVMTAIARGRTRPTEIATAIGATGPAAISPYLDRLADMRLIERRLPVTEDPTSAPRRGLHVLADQYLTFWFRFVAPSHTYLESGMADLVLDTRIMPNLDQHTSKPAFEDTARQYLLRRQRSGGFPFTFNRIGAWWDRREEIDVVAVDDRRVVLVGECKWTNEWVKVGDLNELRRKAAVAGFPADTRYALFAKSGFDPALVDAAKAEGALLVSVDEMYAAG